MMNKDFEIVYTLFYYVYIYRVVVVCALFEMTLTKIRTLR